MVLDALIAQASPSGSFEVMLIGPVGEAAFHQVASADAIKPSFFTLGLFYGFINEFLAKVAHDRAPGLGLRAGVF